MPRYFLYARKSSESEDRQVLSIESQIRELREFADAKHLDVVEVFSESQSAKEPGRPIFDKMIAAAGRGKADGLLCWKLDRLARNAKDGGNLIYALDTGHLQAITTPAQTFTNSSNDKFYMNMEFGIAKKYVDDLSENVRRGNRAKLRQGWIPGPAPIGYLNDRAMKTVVPDPDRFPLVRKIWDEALRGEPIPEILKEATQDWGLRTPQLGRRGGALLSRSSIYRILSDPFYFGLILRKGVAYPGAHIPMITKDEFHAVQQRLQRPRRRPNHQEDFSYTGLMVCGECGSSVTAEHKVNRYGTHYVYYHCTKKRDSHCSQPHIRLEELEAQLEECLKSISIDNDLHQWASDELGRLYRQEQSAATAKGHSFEEGLKLNQDQQGRLVKLAVKGLLSEEQYHDERGLLVEEELHLREKLADAEKREVRWFEYTKQALTFANRAQEYFKKGGVSERRKIISALGSNFVLKDKKVLVQAHKPLVWIGQMNKSTDWLSKLDVYRTWIEEGHTAATYFPSWASLEV